MEGFVLELNKRETAQGAEPDPAAILPDGHGPSLQHSGLLDRSLDQDVERPDAIGTFRGLAFGIPIAVGLWLAIIGAVYVIA